MRKIILVVEKSKDGKLWGRVEFDNNLMVDSAKSIDALENKMKRLLNNFHEIKPSRVRFELAFDLTALFAEKDYLNVSSIALKAGINPTLMRQYVSGFKFPSLERAKSIESVIRNLGQELAGIKLAVAKTQLTARPKNRRQKKAV